MGKERHELGWMGTRTNRGDTVKGDRGEQRGISSWPVLLRHSRSCSCHVSWSPYLSRTPQTLGDPPLQRPVLFVLGESLAVWLRGRVDSRQGLSQGRRLTRIAGPGVDLKHLHCSPLVCSKERRNKKGAAWPQGPPTVSSASTRSALV